MPDDRRVYHPGGTFFFTVNLLQRQHNDHLVRPIFALRPVVRTVSQQYPFTICGWVILPDHLHGMIKLPAADSDYILRWRLIKSRFSKSIPKQEYRSVVRQRRGERGIWQQRFWETLIRDEKAYSAYIDYLHFNPVKHGLVGGVKDWPYSTLHRYVQTGVYPLDWAGNDDTQSITHIEQHSLSSGAMHCALRLLRN